MLCFFKKLFLCDRIKAVIKIKNMLFLNYKDLSKNSNTLIKKLFVITTLFFKFDFVFTAPQLTFFLSNIYFFNAITKTNLMAETIFQGKRGICFL